MQFGLAGTRVGVRNCKPMNACARCCRACSSPLVRTATRLRSSSHAVEPQEFQIKGPFLKLTAGKVLSGQPDATADAEVMLGQDLARVMGAQVGSSLTLLAGTTEGALNAIDVQVRGIFTTGTPEVDRRMAYVHLATAQEILRTNKVSTLSVYLFGTEQTESMMTDIAARYSTSRSACGIRLLLQGGQGAVQPPVRCVGADLMVLVFFSVSNTMSMSVMERTARPHAGRTRRVPYELYATSC